MADEAAGDAREILYGMLNVGREQQAAVAEALAALVVERKALARERAGLAQQAAAVGAAAAELRQVVGSLGPGLARGTEAAAERAVARGLAVAGGTAAAAVEAASRPMLARLDGVAAQARVVEASLRRVGAWASWRLLGRGLAVVAALAGLLWGTHLGVWWWTEWDLGLAQAQKALLLAEIAGLQGQRADLAASRDELVRSGALAKAVRCGPARRLCIQVDEAGGQYGDPPNYRVILGY